MKSKIFPISNGIDRKQKFVILVDIRSVFNVGSIFRTSDALGVDKIFLCGCTPTPKDRFGRKRQDLAKVALGAEESVKWEYCEDARKLLRKLKKQKIQIIALEQNQKSVNYKKVKAKFSTALILGEEVNGLSQKILDLADVVAEIPMRGAMVRQAHHPRQLGRGKESLNVSVAFGIAGFEILI